MNEQQKEIAIVALLVAGALIGLWLLPDVIIAFGALISMVAASVTSGTVTGIVVAPLAIYAVVVALVAWGGLKSYSLLVSFSKTIPKEPFVWSTPLLAIAAGFMVSLATNFYDGQKLVRVMFSILTGMTMLTGGYLLTLKRLGWRIVGILLQLAGPAFLATFVMVTGGATGVAGDLDAISARTWLALGLSLGMAALTTICAFLHSTTTRRKLSAT